MSKKNTDILKHKITVNLKDVRGEDLTFNYEGADINNFIKAIGDLTLSFKSINTAEEGVRKIEKISYNKVKSEKNDR